ncbi:MAG: hypothetical protein J5829_06690 [Lachnospiraceae bacterium]|nr:hypothetical protein [Lachnospiraceae bacterium]
MKRKYFYDLIAKLAVVLIIITSLPVYASSDTADPVSQNGMTDMEEALSENVPVSGPDCAVPERAEVPAAAGENAAGGNTEPLKIVRLDVYIYDDKDNPDRITNNYYNMSVDGYSYSPEEDSAVPFERKKYVYWSGATEMAPKIMLKVTANRNDVEYEFERLGRSAGKQLDTTGRIAEDHCVCEQIGVYRIHVYALDGSGSERICYTEALGMDSEEPHIHSVTFAYVGGSKRGRNGNVRYGAGQITINGARDLETGLHEKAYMFDYPYGTWQESNVLDARTGNHYVATRDRVGNVRTDFVQVYNIDSDPPKTTFTEADTPSSNGYRKTVSMKVNAEDETDVPEKFISLDGNTWVAGNTIEISENGVYDVYTRDVFEHISENRIEIASIDREPPRVSWNIEHVSRGGGYSAKETLRVLAVDEKAGITGDAYSFDGGSTWVSENSLSISENGTYTICVRDALGNESGISSVVVTDIDNKRPKIVNAFETRENVSGIYASASKITVEAKDDESGLHQEPVFFEETGKWSSDVTLTVRKNGVYPFRVRDRVLNTESSSIKIENIDPDPPQCEIEGNPESLTMSKVILKLNVKDEVSGIRDIYMSDAKAGIKKKLIEYPCSSDGAGKKEGSLDVEITSNGEYLFYLTDMCGNEKIQSVTVTKIIKPKTPSKPEEPSGEDGKEGGDGGNKGGTGGGKNPGSGGSGSGSETVVIGGNGSGKKEKKDETPTGITIRNGSVSEEKASGSGGIGTSSNRVSRGSDSGAELFEEKDEVSENMLTDICDDDDYSTDIFEGGDEEYFAENSPHELEMIPNPDLIDVKEEKHSNTGVIAGTVILMIIGLSALTVFLLSKKGLIDLTGIFGKKNEE